MKKLMLDPNAFDAGEVLTRAELKKVMGGFGSSPNCGEGHDCKYVDAKGSSEDGLCSTYLFEGDDNRPHAICYCKTEHHTAPSDLSTNGGVSKCQGL